MNSHRLAERTVAPTGVTVALWAPRFWNRKGAYITVCESHKQSFDHLSSREAKLAVEDPAEFCKVCQVIEIAESSSILEPVHMTGHHAVRRAQAEYARREIEYDQLLADYDTIADHRTPDRWCA